MAAVQHAQDGLQEVKSRLWTNFQALAKNLGVELDTTGAKPLDEEDVFFMLTQESRNLAHLCDIMTKLQGNHGNEQMTPYNLLAEVVDCLALNFRAIDRMRRDNTWAKGDYDSNPYQSHRVQDFPELRMLAALKHIPLGHLELLSCGRKFSVLSCTHLLFLYDLPVRTLILTELRAMSSRLIDKLPAADMEHILRTLVHPATTLVAYADSPEGIKEGKRLLGMA